MGGPTMTGGKRPAGTNRALTGAPAHKDAEWLRQKYYLHEIPRIMDRNGWRQGAEFQRLWFALPARRRTDKNVRALHVNNRTIKMDWVLSFARAKSVYDKLVAEIQSGAFWQQNPENKQLKDMIKKAQARLGRSDARVPFPADKNLGRLKPWDLYDAHVAERSVGGIEFDGLLAALGRFELLVVPVGTATVQAQSMMVQIEKVGIFVWDSFDFNDDHGAATDAADGITCETRLEKKFWGAVKAFTCSQPLGVWNLKDGKLRNPHGSIGDKVNVWLKVGYTTGTKSIEKKQRDDMTMDPKATGVSDVYIGNASYRTYRQKTGRGGDFIVCSDVREVLLPSSAAGATLFL